MYDINLKKTIIRLKLAGVSHKTISKHFNIPKSTIATWVKGIEYPINEKRRKRNVEKFARTLSKNAQSKRLEYQQEGVIQAKLNEPLHIIGCMLYWGEGSKSKNSVSISNTDVGLLLKFKEFLNFYFDIPLKSYRIRIQAYIQNNLTEKDICRFWLDKLSLKDNNLRKCKFESPKETKSNNIHLYGTCSLRICNTRIVQHIFGAIGEYGNLDSKKWLN